MSLTDLNYLLKATGIAIAERLGLKEKSENNKKSKAIKIHVRKKRLGKSVKEWRKDISKLVEVRKNTE